MPRTKEKKTIAEYERMRDRKNERQKQYRKENPELQEIWKQRSYRNYLEARGWQCTAPADFPTLEQVHTKRNIQRQLDSPPADLSDFSAYFDIDESELPL